MNITSQNIEALLRQLDIEGYIQLGAPSDEYSSEAEVLYQALSELDDKDITQDAVELITIEVWKNSFNLGDADLNMRRPDIHNFAREVVRLYSETV